mgnify:FL=1
MEENTCEMAGCEIEMESVFGDMKIYGEVIGRDIRVCAECHEEYTDLDTYGRRDYARRWLATTQEEIQANWIEE